MARVEPIFIGWTAEVIGFQPNARAQNTTCWRHACGAVRAGALQPDLVADLEQKLSVDSFRLSHPNLSASVDLGERIAL